MRSVGVPECTTPNFETVTCSARAGARGSSHTSAVAVSPPVMQNGNVRCRIPSPALLDVKRSPDQAERAVGTAQGTTDRVNDLRRVGRSFTLELVLEPLASAMVAARRRLMANDARIALQCGSNVAVDAAVARHEAGDGGSNVPELCRAVSDVGG